MDFVNSSILSRSQIEYKTEPTHLTMTTGRCKLASPLQCPVVRKGEETLWQPKRNRAKNKKKSQRCTAALVRTTAWTGIATRSRIKMYCVKEGFILRTSHHDCGSFVGNEKQL